ncbi:MAG: ASPIC/UnbV domain-containing protein, partial [Verrucomicrobiota bacterium]
MPSSPLSASQAGGARDPESDFRKGLARLDQLIDSGVGLSGHERNCGFVNVPAGEQGGRRFAIASAVLGIDQDDDARSPVLVDWDRDGDLDLWVSNRTAPMLRYFQNGLENEKGARSLAIRLRGVTVNRDGIGARVTVRDANGGVQSRTLKAGEGFLGQSSKWLSFGLGDADGPFEVSVRWPGGKTEDFAGVTPGGRFHLTEGGKVTKDAVLPVKIGSDAPEVQIRSSSRLVQARVPSRWVLPRLPYQA